jgi:hypothetical protein
MAKTQARLRQASQTELEMELDDGDRPAFKTALGAMDIDSLIGGLAHFRASMTPEVARQPPQGQNASGPSDPLFAVYDVPVLPGKYVAIRHPGIGWLSFLFPKAEAEKLGKALLAEDQKQNSGRQTPTDHLH